MRRHKKASPHPSPQKGTVTTATRFDGKKIALRL
jgi:hypothetical protein